MALFYHIDVLSRGESLWRLRALILVRATTLLTMSGDLRWTVIGLGLTLLTRLSASVGAWLMSTVKGNASDASYPTFSPDGHQAADTMVAAAVR